MLVVGQGEWVGDNLHRGDAVDEGVNFGSCDRHLEAWNLAKRQLVIRRMTI